MLTSSEVNSCCICRESGNSKPFKKAEDYSLLRCNKCKLVFLEEYPKDLFNFLNELDQKESLEFWSTPRFFQKYKFVFEKYFSERFQEIGHFTDFSNGILDVGSGYGFWADYLKRKKIDVYGVEVDALACQYAREHFSIPVKNHSFEQFETEKKYSCITMVDVLEHFEKPEEALRKSGELLEDDGVLFIQVPNVLGFKIPNNHGYGLPYHLWQFDFSSLKRLLELEGFVIKFSWTGVQGVIGSMERGEDGPLRRLSWKIAKLINRGNRLHVIAQKVHKREIY